MSAITKPAVREIISNFAEEIRDKIIKDVKPSKSVINFRTDIVDNIERDVVKVPLGLLRFRKDNGRIASNVLDYEYTNGPLDEAKEETQDLLRSFLEKKDPEKSEVLEKNILHSGQRDEAIITADGFLINGNRRKMVMEKLNKEYPEDERFAYMKVVILPGANESGGQPTLLEIEKLENRYQLQSEGKSEYYGFDRALSIRRKMEIGLSLRDQISDDPQYTNASKEQIRKAIRGIENDLLKPLECVDRYLKQFHRDKQYHTISTGMGDREGRWQAFIDYSNTYNSKLTNKNYQIEYGIEEEDIGDIEEAAFDIVRLRNVPDMPKVHTIMRDLHKYCSSKDGRKEIFSIPNKVDPLLPTEECFEDDEQKEPLSGKDIDAKWAAKFKEPITFHLKRASQNYQSQKEKETPIGLLDAALKKLKHKDMDIAAISVFDYDKAQQLTRDIQSEAQSIESAVYHQKKNLKKLTTKDS